MALMTAKAMNLPLVIIRKDMKVSEGPTLSMTYVTGGSNKVESMSLPRKALKPDSKVILIDDFMRGGGTLKGMKDLMHEFWGKSNWYRCIYIYNKTSTEKW